MSSPGNPMN
jgi:hypothetical protein